MAGISWMIEGHAIVSDDDRIADAEGRMPQSLRNDADWRHFQAQLDASQAVVLGRLGHETTPNAKSRLRVVVSGSVDGLVRRADGWWWNPAAVPILEMLRNVVPAGGRIAVPGGKRVFDLFLGFGYHAFHLTRAHGVRLPGGTALFSAVDAGKSAEACLRENGLVAGAERVLDPSGPVVLTVWSRTGTGRFEGADKEA